MWTVKTESLIRMISVGLKKYIYFFIFSHSAFPSISHRKPAVGAHRHILHTHSRSAAITLTHKAAHQWVSGRRLPWQHIPSHVAAWSEVWCCWTSPPFLCSALLPVCFHIETQNGTVHIPRRPPTLCYLVEYKTINFLSPTLSFFSSM